MRVKFPNPERIRSVGYSMLSHIPFLIDDNGEYPTEANRYLRERALGEWQVRLTPQIIGTAPPFRTVVMTRPSCETMARRVAAFLLWCTASSLDWRHVEYSRHLLHGWQRDMLNGTYTKSRRSLSNGTINSRISEATYFLVWAGERGYREPLQTGAQTKTASYRTPKHRSGLARLGSLTVKPSHITLPTDAEIAAWLISLRRRSGTVIALIAETMMRTGLRITEANQLRADDIPRKTTAGHTEDWRADWKSAQQVPVIITMGLKGPKISPGVWRVRNHAGYSFQSTSLIESITTAQKGDLP